MSSIQRPDIRQGLGRAGHYAKDTLGGFRTFLLRGNVVDLAIGIVIGAAFTSVVNALVKDIITPLVPVSQGNLSDAVWSPGGKIAIHYGDFINAVISFVIVAAVLYFFVVRPVAALLARYKPPVVAAPTTRDCPYCLQAIPLQATRCAYCTSPVPPTQEQAPAPVAPQPDNVPRRSNS